mgnify:CR=1 FL=1
MRFLGFKVVAQENSKGKLMSDLWLDVDVRIVSCYGL